MKRKIVYALVFAASLTLSLTGQGPGVGKPENPSLFELHYQASQLVASFPVDPEIARKWVPPAWNLAIDGNGKAKGILALIRYPNHAVLTTPNSPPLQDGEEIAPAAVAHFWFVLTGEAQVLPVPGANVTSATSYYYDVADFVTSKTAHSVFRRAGRPAILVREITVVDQGASQVGEIAFLNGRRITLYAIAPPPLPMPLKLGGNVWQWHAGGVGEMGNDMGIRLVPATGYPSNVNTTRVQFLALVPGAPNATRVTIHADPGTGFEDCYGMSDVLNAPGSFFSLINIVLNGSRGDLAWTTYPPSPIPVPPALP